MLFKKLLRDMRKNLFPFLSIFFLAFMAVYVYAGFKSSNIGIERIRQNYHADCALADYWIYGQDFDEAAIERVKNTSGISDAQGRTALELSHGDHPITLYLQDENRISKPYLIEGSAYDPSDSSGGIWLNNRYAEENGLAVGSSITLTLKDFSAEFRIQGLIMHPEYEYYAADSDINPDFSDIGYAFIGRASFPYAAYVKELIRNADDDMLDAIARSEAFAESGIDFHSVDTDVLLKHLPDDKLEKSFAWNQIAAAAENGAGAETESSISEALHNAYELITDRENMNGLRSLDSELKQHEVFAAVFPLIFALIALMVIITTMSRIIDEQRIQIGTMKALGITQGKVMRHYTAFGFILSLLGAALGAWAGPKTLGGSFKGFMSLTYTMPAWDYDYDISFVYAALIVTAVSTLTAYWCCKKIIRLPARDILYPKAPKKAKTCIFEKLPFWNRLGFANRYNLRDLSRAKLRSLLTAVGIAGGTVLITASFGSKDTINFIRDWTYHRVQNAEYEVMLEQDAALADADRLCDAYSGELVMNAGAEFRKAGSGENHKSVITVTEGKGLYNVTDSDTEILKTEHGDFLVTEKFAEKYGVQSGDSLEWRIFGSDIWTTTKITGICRSAAAQGITMLRADFEKTGNEFSPALLFTNQAAEKAADETIVSAVYSRDDLLKSWDKSMEIFDMFVAVFVLSAIILSLIVICNSGILSFNERRKELAVLKVMGIKNGNIRRIMMMQNIWMTVIGALAALPFGKLAVQGMFVSNGSNTDFEPHLTVSTYVISFAAIFVISTVINYRQTKKLKKIDMAEAMKAME